MMMSCELVERRIDVVESGMLWMCAVSLLFQNVTLSQVLEADDILQECKADNKALIQL